MYMHAEQCNPCRVRLLELVDLLDRPHETEPKLLHSMYNSTESAEREHPGRIGPT